MGSNFRTSTPMGDWRSFKFTHADTGITFEEGKIYKVRDAIGILFTDISYDSNGCKEDAERSVGDECVLVYHIEKVMVNKVASAVFLPGDVVYWSGVQGAAVTNVYSSGAIWIGIATEPAVADAVQVEIDMKGEVGLWIRTEA